MPGKSEESELILRILSGDADEVMPPPKSNRKLTPRQVEMLKRWVDEGAKWGTHWAFEPPRRPEPPEVRDARWPRNAIDRFVRARLDAEGLGTSPEAERTTLIRRVTLDLTGLPPTIGEVDAFLADRSPEAFEKVVDRLLASPRYGERMAMDWLDAARYADTNGYQNDFARSMWPWRDWVIEAINRNQPFDQFLVEQLAGDLLPGATRAQKVATGIQPQQPDRHRGGLDRRGMAGRECRRPRRDHGDRLPRPHDGLRPLPRPQVRPGLAGGVLRVLRLLQQRQREGGLHRDARQRAPARRPPEPRTGEAREGARRRHRRRGAVVEGAGSGPRHAPAIVGGGSNEPAGDDGAGRLGLPLHARRRPPDHAAGRRDERRHLPGGGASGLVGGAARQGAEARREGCRFRRGGEGRQPGPHRPRLLRGLGQAARPGGHPEQDGRPRLVPGLRPAGGQGEGRRPPRPHVAGGRDQGRDERDASPGHLDARLRHLRRLEQGGGRRGLHQRPSRRSWTC